MTYPRTGRRRSPARALPAALALLGALTGCGVLGTGVTGGGTAPPAAGAAPTGAADPSPTMDADADADPAPGTTADGDQPVEPCSLVTKGEAERTVGLTLQDPVPGAESCTYTAPPTGPTGQLEVYIGDGARNLLRAERALGHEITPVAGVGDEAYAEDGAIFFQSGGVWVALWLVRTDDLATYRGPLTDLARTVVGRL